MDNNTPSYHSAGQSLLTNQYPLTSSQRLIWAGQQLSPQAPLYNMAISFEINGPLNIDLFQKAVDKMIRECDAMRSTFGMEDGQPYQIIEDSLNYKIQYFDFSDKNEYDINEWLATSSRRVFDLTEELFEISVLRINSESFIWFFNQHHLITDAWSMTLQYQSVSKYYAKLVKGDHLEGQTSIFSFRNYLKKQNNSSTEGQKLDAHWQQKLTSDESMPSLSSSRNSAMKSASSRHSERMSDLRMKAFTKLANDTDLRSWSQELTQFNVLSTVLLVLIYRLSSERNVGFGAPVHNRKSKEEKSTDGMFIKVFPFGIHIQPESSYLTVYKQVQTEANAFLMNAQKNESTASLNRLFNVVFNFINTHFGDFGGMPTVPTWHHSGHSDPGHQLRLQAHDFAGNARLTFEFDFNDAVFSTDQQKEIPKLFFEIFDQFSQDKNIQIDAPTADELALMDSFNETEGHHPKDQTIVHLFEEMVLSQPNAIAVEIGDEQLTYDQLNKKSNQLAHYLSSKGIGPDHMVGICLDRSLDMMIGLLGILKSGGAYVPIDPDYPAARMEHIAQQGNLQFIILNQDSTESVGFQSAQLGNVEHINLTEEKRFSDLPIINLKTKPRTKDLAYVIFTSGSTGRPKGAMNQHDGVMNRLQWVLSHFDLQPSIDVILQKTTFCFDVSVWELFCPLISGVKLVMAKSGGQKDTDYLVDLIEEKKVTMMHFVPPAMEVFLLGMKAGRCPKLKNVICSGEALKPAHVMNFRHLLPTASLYNLYGPTEAAIDVTYWKAPNKNVAQVVERVPIGKALPNTQLYVLNEQMKKVPFGMKGELYIGGVQVARGYVGRPDLTDERFLENPFGSGKLYKTGDITHLEHDGNMYYHGRSDHQVKVRGFRIELGEIEHALGQFKGVRQCAVLAWEDEYGQKNLRAYIVSDGIIAQNDLTSFLEERLPEYMVPKEYIYLESLPITSNGKLDRRQLSDLKPQFNSTSTAYVAPRNEIEELVQDIWKNVLKKEKISIHDRFFDVGGDSLSGIRVIARINEAAELNIPVTNIFTQPTIALLAQNIEQTILKLMKEVDA